MEREKMIPNGIGQLSALRIRNFVTGLNRTKSGFVPIFATRNACLGMAFEAYFLSKNLTYTVHNVHVYHLL
jgi:hypothetical protein